FFSSRRRHTRFSRDWSSDVCSSDLYSGSCSQREAKISEDSGLSGRRGVGCDMGGCCTAEKTAQVSGAPARLPSGRRTGGRRGGRSEERRVGEEGRRRASREEEERTE